MGLINKKVAVGINSKNINYYKNLGYPIPRRKDNYNKFTVPRGTKIIVKVEDLPDSSNVKVNVQCDCCDRKLKNIVWQDYRKQVKEDGKYYCKKCAMKLYGVKKQRITRLKNGKSFTQWCIDNNHQDVLNLWDYELNDCNPNEILYGTTNKYYFKCSRELHESELKCINNFTNGEEGVMNCKKCNSFAQWGIDNLGEDFLNKYWDYEKNTIDPWFINKSTDKIKVWIKCLKKEYHGSYDIKPSSFTSSNCRCSYCCNLKVHPLDSLGKLLEDKGLLHLWSNKNNKSPYEYAPNSIKYVWWKCPNNKHKDYYRKINDSNICNFRCPDCSNSKGEENIDSYLINNYFIKISQKEFNQLIDKDKYNKYYYIPQKEFDGLVGLKKGNLSYDFYIPKLNLLIEFQGEQHERYIPGFHKSYDDFLKQVEHDRRKREYAKKHNINLLEIWYWDYDRIEEILDRELNLNITNCINI